MRTFARIFLVLCFATAIVLMAFGLWELYEQRGIWTALAVFPGIPLGVAVLLFAAATAFEDES